MSPLPILAHGGTAGAFLEVTILLLPVALFALLSWRSSRRRRAETTPEGDTGRESGPHNDKEVE